MKGDSTATLLPTGTELGGCRVVRFIDKGGMGEVYLAKHTLLDKDFAIKILPPTKFDDEHVARFIREARECSKIDHPNVITIHNIDRKNDSYFIVMQFIDGRNLAQIVKTQGGPIPWRMALRILQHAARGVQAVHDQGLLHRDIKPSNIMVGSKSQVVLMDFGLVRDEAASDLTKVDAILGTPIYMAPEQSTGAALDKRCDVYALGATLYFLLTARHPFEGSVHSVLSQKIGGQRPPAPHTVNKNVPIEVSRFVERAMDPRLASRIPDVKTFGRELLRLLKAADAADVSSTETSRMSALKTSGNLPTQEDAIVPELEPIRNIVTLGSGETLRKALPWAIGVGSLLLLVVVGLFLNSVFGNRPKKKKDPGTDGNGVQSRKKKEPAVPAGVDPKTMVRIPVGFVRLGNDKTTLTNHFDRQTRPPGFSVDEWNSQKRIWLTQWPEKEERTHVKEFWIDKYEVTNAEYAKFVAAKGHRAPSHWNGRTTPPEDLQEHPVTRVSYEDAEAYATWAGKKLPTVAQWTRAFRGDEKKLYPWGDTFDPTRANVTENPNFSRGGKTLPVTATPKDKTDFGVFNMVGNVNEIMRDRPVQNGTRMIILKGAKYSYRGCAYGIGSAQYHFKPSFNYLLEEQQDKSFGSIGFRCVVEVP